MLVDEEVYIKKSEKIKAETWEEMKYFILIIALLVVIVIALFKGFFKKNINHRW
jgi:hypothetical protein